MRDFFNGQLFVPELPIMFAEPLSALHHSLKFFLYSPHSSSFFIDVRSAGFLGSAHVKEPTCQCKRCRDTGLYIFPGLGKSPGEGHGDPLQYSCLENPMDREAWQATVDGGHTESDTTEMT